MLCPAWRQQRGHDRRDIGRRAEEACALVRAIDVHHIATETLPLRQARPATLFGSGQVERVGSRVAEEDIGLAFVDASLSPVQQRNLERAWNTKVIDRTGLILEIFGERAVTREGTLQVEMAALTYQRSRLVRSWTHLERQRGGFGFVGGPGESQLEIDRRLIDKRLVRIRKELADVVRMRTLHRGARRRWSCPVVALVGYTNAGKSTLFARLTGAEVYADDKLFATLDPTMRGLELPTGRRVILLDTVGFISQLPTALVAAFRATLEEVVEADAIVHVRDMSRADRDEQAADVVEVLGELGIGPLARRERMIEAMNKIDLLAPAERERLAAVAARRDDVVAVSAATGEGSRDLLSLLGERLDADRRILEIDLGPGDGEAIGYLYRHGEVIERRDGADSVHFKVGLGAEDLARFEKKRGRSSGA